MKWASDYKPEAEAVPWGVLRDILAMIHLANLGSERNVGRESRKDRKGKKLEENTSSRETR